MSLMRLQNGMKDMRYMHFIFKSLNIKLCTARKPYRFDLLEPLLIAIMGLKCKYYQGYMSDIEIVEFFGAYKKI